MGKSIKDTSCTGWRCVIFCTAVIFILSCIVHKFYVLLPSSSTQNRHDSNSSQQLDNIEKSLLQLQKFRIEGTKKLYSEVHELKKIEQAAKEEIERLESIARSLTSLVRLGFSDTSQQNQELVDHVSYFNGLNGTDIHRKYPGISFLKDYKMQLFLDDSDKKSLIMKGNPKNIEDVNDFLAEDRFYELIEKIHIKCEDIQHLGNVVDGGWDVCLSEPYIPSKDGCLVYSFGINNDFSFDDAISLKYGCLVRSFDPSMKRADHQHSKNVWFYQLGLGGTNTINDEGWKLKTLGSIISEKGDAGRTIDVLKIDIDYKEWGCFPTIFKEGILSKVKQFVLEIHTPDVYETTAPSTKEHYYSMHNDLLMLEKLGFRRFHVHHNSFGDFKSPRSGKKLTCCYEISYINTNYLTP